MRLGGSTTISLLTVGRLRLLGVRPGLALLQQLVPQQPLLPAPQLGREPRRVSMSSRRRRQALLPVRVPLRLSVPQQRLLPVVPPGLVLHPPQVLKPQRLQGPRRGLAQLLALAQPQRPQLVLPRALVRRLERMSRRPRQPGQRAA
jgi:hypothetical protein